MPSSRIATLAALSFLAHTALAQFIQQGEALVATGLGSAQGSSVALSADGNTALIGLPNYSFPVEAAAVVYTRANGTWTQQSSALVPAGIVPPSGPNQVAVALSGDGNTAIIGVSVDSNKIGGAWVFTRSAGVWRQQGGKLLGAGAAGPAEQGYSVSLSADGNTAIIGGPADTGNLGAAWIFQRSGSSWQQVSKLVGSGSSGNSRQGRSVALSADGNTAMVGGPTDDPAGAGWVFVRSGGVWVQQGNKLTGSGSGTGFGPFNGTMGQAAALSADGNTAILGEFGAVPGSVWIFTRQDNVWTQQGPRLQATSVGLAEQGYSVAISADGNTAVVAGPFDSGRGAVWTYRRSGGAWKQQGDRLFGPDSLSPAAQFGISVALSADGATLLAGAPGNQRPGGGGAFVFVADTAPSIFPGGVVNGGSFLPGIAPGTWITIQGSNLASSTRSWNDSDFSGTALPTQLDNVSVTVNGKPAYVSYISPSQLNVLSPDDSTVGNLQVEVKTPGGAKVVAAASQDTYSPALFTFTAGIVTYAAAVHADGSLIGPDAPCKPGETIMLFGTGFGPAKPASPSGQLSPAAALSAPVSVTIGGVDANVQYAGLVGAGLDQFNVQIPNVPDGDVGVRLTVGGLGGKTSQLRVFLAVRR
jgi:uncharacterized protein (TIGR03437 family)